MRIEIIDKISLAGIKVSVDTLEKKKILGEYWKKYVDILIEADEIDNMRECYGYNENYVVEKGEVTFDYFIGMRKSSYNKIPQGFLEADIPEGKYAVYTYRGIRTPELLEEFYENIFYRWLREEGLVHRMNASFEYYDARYVHESGESELDIWVPVE